MAECAGEALPAALKDPTVVREPCGDAVSDCVELLETDGEPVKLFSPVGVCAEVPVATGLVEGLIEGEADPVKLSALKDG